MAEEDLRRRALETLRVLRPSPQQVHISATSSHVLSGIQCHSIQLQNRYTQKAYSFFLPTTFSGTTCILGSTLLAMNPIASIPSITVATASGF